MVTFCLHSWCLKTRRSLTHVRNSPCSQGVPVFLDMAECSSSSDSRGLGGGDDTRPQFTFLFFPQSPALQLNRRFGERVPHPALHFCEERGNTSWSHSVVFPEGLKTTGYRYLMSFPVLDPVITGNVLGFSFATWFLQCSDFLLNSVVWLYQAK